MSDDATRILVDTYLPDGNAGRLITLLRMVDIASIASRTGAVQGIAAGLRGSPVAAWKWLYYVWRLTPDPVDEQIVWPDALIAQAQRHRYFTGDCDDVAVLLAALGLACDLDVRYVAIAQTEARELDHVWCEWHVPGSGDGPGSGPVWVPIDPIMPDLTVGQSWPHYTAKIVVDIPSGDMRVSG